MTLLDILAELAAPDIAVLRQVALVFDADLRQRLVSVQESFGDNRHVAMPVALTDGRWMLCGDLLTECQPGGLFYEGFSRLDESRFGEIAVVPIAETVALLPEQPLLGE